jgi:hypothetical protein
MNHPIEQLIQNDVFFFAIIAIIFFFVGFVIGSDSTRRKHNEYFDHCFDHHKRLSDVIKDLRKQLSEQKQ